jgi:hypothetical protein
MRRTRWMILLTGFLVLVLCIYFKREQVERMLIAFRVYHTHIFTPPPSRPNESGWNRLGNDIRFYWDFSEIPVARNKRLKLLEPALKPMLQEIGVRQASGEGMQYSMHIYREIRWLMNFTPDLPTTRARIADLQISLSQHAQQQMAAEQQPADGSWGWGLSVWYLKLYYSVDEALEYLQGQEPRYPLSFLDRINSPEKITAHLNSVLYNDFTKTGVFNREELDETFSALARLFLGHKKIGYTFHPQLKEALQNFVKFWQNPVTGCWGQWLLDRQGRVWKMDDMGMTFHVISDSHGEVDHLDLIAKRLLQLTNINFPAGILFDGHYENHLNWDAVKIFRYAWPKLDSTTHQQIRDEIARMLKWCLGKSYLPDGSFKVSELDDTMGDAYYYGVTFLVETGFFRRQDRFWTDQDFPEATAIHDHIKTRLKSMGFNDPKLKDAYETLVTAE